MLGMSHSLNPAKRVQSIQEQHYATTSITNNTDNDITCTHTVADVLQFERRSETEGSRGKPRYRSGVSLHVEVTHLRTPNMTREKEKENRAEQSRERRREELSMR